MSNSTTNGLFSLNSLFSHDENGDVWPAPLRPEAFHGLAGEFVHMVEPHTESDPAALLVQFLVAFGNCIGRTAYYSIESRRHYGNLFACLVGASSVGRKGTSWAYVETLFEEIDPDWLKGRVRSGLSSGEGLVWHVRDPVRKVKPGSNNGEAESTIVDPGEEDKRLLALETEFSNVLAVKGRESNTLSSLLRDAWDRGNLSTLTKNNPVSASDAHISVIGHITAEELRRQLTATDMANGFANRYLWPLTRRSKRLPDGGNLDRPALLQFAGSVYDAVTFARSVQEVGRDEAAKQRWHEVYPYLTREDVPGVVGSILARAAPQTLRLALLYALLDKSETICLPHLEAALAVWLYCEASARIIFGEAGGDTVADKILAALQNAPDGLTRTHISALFKGHVKADRIAAALDTLLQMRKAKKECRKDKAGRPEERWFAVFGCEKSEKSEKSLSTGVSLELTREEQAEAMRIATGRKAGHEGRRLPEEDAGEGGNWQRDYFGAAGELLARRFLQENSIRFHHAEDVADRPPVGDDITLLPSGSVVGVKTPLLEAPGLSVNTEAFAKSDALCFWPVRFVSEGEALLYAPVLREVVGAAEVREGRKGSYYHFLAWDDLAPLRDAEVLRQLAADGGAVLGSSGTLPEGCRQW